MAERMAKLRGVVFQVNKIASVLKGQPADHGTLQPGILAKTICDYWCKKSVLNVLKISNVK